MGCDVRAKRKRCITTTQHPDDTAGQPIACTTLITISHPGQGLFVFITAVGMIRSFTSNSALMSPRVDHFFVVGGGL